MGFFSFGKKKKRSIKHKKPPAKILRMCKKLKIRTTTGKRKTYKSVKVLRKLIAKKLRSKKKKTSRRKVTRRKVSRRNRFSFGDSAGAFMNPGNYGYNQPVLQTPGVLSQSSQCVTSSDNANRPAGFNLTDQNLPIYGVGRPFFNDIVPTQVGPRSIGFMGQPDGSLYPCGGPFVGYSKAAFGLRGLAPKPPKGWVNTYKRGIRTNTKLGRLAESYGPKLWPKGLPRYRDPRRTR
jgi:hypothetical protein